MLQGLPFTFKNNVEGKLSSCSQLVSDKQNLKCSQSERQIEILWSAQSNLWIVYTKAKSYMYSTVSAVGLTLTAQGQWIHFWSLVDDPWKKRKEEIEKGPSISSPGLEMNTIKLNPFICVSSFAVGCSKITTGLIILVIELKKNASQVQIRPDILLFYCNRYSIIGKSKSRKICYAFPQACFSKYNTVLAVSTKKYTELKGPQDSSNASHIWTMQSTIPLRDTNHPGLHLKQMQPWTLFYLDLLINSSCFGVKWKTI